MTKHEEILAMIAEARAIAWEDHGRCFGFARHVVNRLGGRVPDYNCPAWEEGPALFYENFHRHLTPVEPRDVRAGDIVTFRRGGGLHIGIYAGEARMAHWRGAEHGVVLERIDVPPLCRGRLEFYRVRRDGEDA